MLRIWHRIDRSHTLDDETLAELVWMAFQSRYGVRWTVVSGDLPMAFLLLAHAEAVTDWLIALVAVTSCLRIALAEAYARYGSRRQRRAVQRRWETAYLVVGTAYASTLALLAHAAVATGDGWLVAWLSASIAGFAFGIVGYVANRPAVAYAMTFAAVGGIVASLALSGNEVGAWLAANLSVGYLAVRSLIERHYATTLSAIADRRTVERLAQTDHLTGLANRRHLEAVVGQALAEQITGLSWLGIDLDGFKAINDAIGHEAGDGVLREAARRIVDAAGEGAFVARTGGDEFVVLLVGGLDRAERVARSIAVDMGDPIFVSGASARIGASVGATAIRPHDTIDAIARRADERMYARKALSRRAA